MTFGPPRCVRCTQDIPQDEREFAMDDRNHPGVLGPCHKRCYDAVVQVDPALPWTDPVSGEVDYEEMQEDLGVSSGEDFDETGESEAWGYGP